MFPGLKPTPQSIINAFVKKQALIKPAAAPAAAPAATFVAKPSTPTIARGVSGLNKYWEGPSADNSLGSMAGLGFGAAAGGIAAAAAGTALLPWVTLGAGLGVAAPQVYDYFTKPKGAPPSVLPPSILSRPDSAPEFNIGVNRGYTYRDKGVFGPQPKILGWNGDTPILQDAPTDGSWASRLANASSKWAWEQKIRDEKQAFEKPGEEATLGLPGRIFKNYIGDFGLAFGTLPERLKGVAARTSQMPKGSNKPYGFLMGQNPEWMPNEDAGHGAVMELFRTLEPESQAIEQLWGFGRGVTGSFANTPEQTLNYKMAGKYSAGERAHIISKFRMDGQWPTDKVGPIQTLDYVNAHLSDAINNAESIFGRLPAGEQLFSMIALPNTAQMIQSKVPKFFRLIPKMGKMDEALVPSFSVLEDWSRIRKSAHHRKTREYMASIAFTTDQTPEFQSAFIKFNPQSNNFWSPNSFAQTVRKGLVKAGATTFQYDIGTIASINATHGLEALLETIFPMFDNDNVGMAINGLLSLKNYGPKGFTDELGNVVNATKEQLDFLQVFKEMGLVDLEVTEGISKLYGLKKGRVVSPINSTNNLVGRQVLRNIVDSVIDQKGVGKEGAQTFVHTKLVDLLTAIKGDLSGKIPDIAALKASGKSTLEINNLVKLGKEAYKLEANRIDRAQMNLLDWAVRATLYTDFKQADYAQLTTPNEWKQWQSFFAKWYQIGTNPGVAVRNSFQDITKLMLQDRQLLMTNNTQFMKYFRDNSQSFTMLRGLGKEGMRKIRARGIEIDLSTKPKNAFENFLTLGTTLMQESEEFNTSLIAAGTIKRIMEKFGEVAPDISDLAGMPPEKIQNLVNIVQSVMLPSELKKAKDMYLRNPKFFQLQDEFVNAIKGINSNGVEERARIAVMEILGKHEGKPNEMKTALQELLNSIIEDHTPKRKFVNGKFVSEEVIRSPIEYRRGKPKPEEEAVVFDAFNDINQAVKTDDLGEALIFARTYPELQYSKQVVEELQEQGVDVQRTTDKIYDENPWLAKAVGETEDTVPEVPSTPSYIINNPPEPSADQVIEQGVFDINVKRIASTYSEPTGSKPGSSQADILNTDEIHRHFDDDFHPDNVPENTQSDTTYDEATRFYRISLNAIKLMLDKLSQDTTGRVINLNTIIMRPNASKDPITFVEFLNQFQPNRQFILKHTHNNFEAVPVKDLAMLRVEIDALERYHNGKLGHIASSLRNDAAYLTRAQEGQRLPDYLGKEKLTYVELSKFFYDPKNNQVNNYVESVWKVFHDLTFGTPESELAYSKLKVMTALTPEERAVAEEVLQQARKVEARAAYLRMQKDIDFPGFPGSPGNVVNRKNDYIAAVEYIKANWMKPGEDFTVEKEALRTLPSKSDIMRDDAKRLLNNLGLSRADAQKVLENLGSRVRQHGKIASKQFKIYELDDLLDAVIEERLIGTGIKKGKTLPEAVSKIFERYITVDGQAYEVVARQGDNITEVYKESSIYGMVPRGESLPAGKLKNANVKETQKFTAAKKRDVVGFIERNEQSSASLFEFTGDADARIIIQALMENPGVSIDAKSHLAFLKNKYPNIKLSSISAEKYSLPIPPEFLDARLKKEKGSKFYVENLGVKIKEAESRGVLDIKKGVKPIENYISTDFYFPELDPQFLPQWEKIIDDMAVSVILSRYGKLSDVDLQNEQAIVSSLHQLYSDTKDYAKLEFVKGLIESLAVKTKNLPIELEDLGKYYREQLIAIELGEILNYKELGKHEELALVIEKKFDQILDAMAAPRVAVTTADASVPIRRTPFVAPRPAAAKVVAAATPSIAPIEGAEQIRTVTLKDNRVIQVKGDGDNMKWMSPSAPVTSQGPRWWPVSDKMKRRIAFATPESLTPIPDAPKATPIPDAPKATPTLAYEFFPAGKQKVGNGTPIQPYFLPALKRNAENGEGWKIHLSVDPKNYQEVDRYLYDKAPGTFKLLKGGEPEDGKDFTIYLGSRDEMEKFAIQLDNELGHVLQIPPKNAGVYWGNTVVVGNVRARFEVTAYNRQAGLTGKNAKYNQYGRSGRSWLDKDFRQHSQEMSAINRIKDPAEKAIAVEKYNTLVKQWNDAADAELLLDYGDFYRTAEPGITTRVRATIDSSSASPRNVETLQADIAALTLQRNKLYNTLESFKRQKLTPDIVRSKTAANTEIRKLGERLKKLNERVELEQLRAAKAQGQQPLTQVSSVVLPAKALTGEFQPSRYDVDSLAKAFDFKPADAAILNFFYRHMPIDLDNLKVARGNFINNADFVQSGVGEVKGFTQAMDDGTHIIAGLKSSDRFTAIHEMNHVVIKNVFDKSKPLAQRYGITDRHIDIVMDWAGVKEGVWQAENHEKLSMGLLRYFIDGVSPSNVLKYVFEKIRFWYHDLYRHIYPELAEMKVPKEVTEVFDLVVTARLRELYASRDAVNLHTQDISEEINALKNSIAALQRASIPPIQRTPFVTAKGLTKSYKDIRIYHGMNDEKERWFTSSETVAKAWVGSTVGKTTTIDPATGKLIVNIYDINPTHSPLKQLQYIDVTPQELAQIKAQNESIMRLKESGITDSVESFLKQRVGLVEEDRVKTYLATLYFDLESLNEAAKRYAEKRLLTMRNYDGAYDLEEDLRTTKKELLEATKKFRAHEEEVELVTKDLKDDLEIAALMSRIKKLKNEVEIGLEKELFAKQDKDYRRITTLETRDPRKKDKVTKFAPVRKNAYGKELKQGEDVEREALETTEFSVSETTSDEIALKKLKAQGKEKSAHAYFIDKLLEENFKLSKILERFEDPNYVPLIPDLKAQAQYHRQQNIDYIQYYYGVEEPFIHHPITRGAKATEFFVPESIMSRSKSLVDWEPSRNPKMQVGELQGEKSKIRETKRLLAEQLLFDQRRDLAEYWLDKQTIERKINSLKSKQKLTKDELVELESLKGKFQALETRVMEGLLPDLQALWNAENKAQVLQVHVWYNDWKALQLTRDEIAERVSRIESIDRELSGDDYVRFASGADVPFFALPMIDAAGQGTRKFKSKKINKEIKELQEDGLYYVPKYSETGLGNTTDKLPTDNQRIEEYRKQLLSYIARIDSDMVVLSDRINRVPQTKQDILNRIQKLSALRDADPRWRYVPVENVKGRNIPINENIELFSPNYLKRVEDTVSEISKDLRPVARNYTDQTLALPVREAPEIPTQSIEAKDLQDNSFKIDTIELAPGYQPIEATQIAGANPNLKYISGTTSQVQGDKNAIFVLNSDNSVSYTDLQPKTETQINEILQADRMNNGGRQSVKSEFVIDQGQYQLSAVELREARVFQTMDSITQLVKAIDLSTSKTAPIAINPEDAQFAEAISKFFIKRQNELNQTRNVAQMVSTEMVNNYVYDYGMKYNFDHWAEMLFGYPLWYLRTFSDFPRQILTDPNYLLQLYQFNRVLNNLHRDEENLPLWMRSSVPLNVERFGLKDLIGTDTVYLPLLSQISPIESLLNGDFTNATREKSWYGAMYNTLYGWGPGPHALIPLAIGTGLMALSTTRDDDSLMNQASQYFGHLGSGTRVISSITAEAEKLGLGSPISGGVSVDPLLMAISAVGSMGAPQGIFLRGLMGASAIAQFATTHVRTKDGVKFVGPVYDQRRVANVLTAWGNEVGKVVNGVEITQEILQDASIVSRDPYVLGAREEYARAYTVWSAAVTEARAQKVLPNIIGYFGGPGVSGRGENEKLQEEMYNSVDALYDMQKDPNISREDYEKAWLTFSIHYPNFPVYSMFKKYGKDAFQVYAYSALSRVGRGASSKSVYDTVGLDYNVVNEFFNNKGVFKYGTDSSNFKEGIVKLALLLQSPDVSTKEEWGEAGILYHKLQREMEIMFPGTTAKQDVYYDLETKLRPAFLREHLDLKSRMDTELSVLVQDPTYRDKMTPYYLSIKEAGDFIKMTYMSQDPVKAEMYQYYLENFRDWATEKEKQFLADYDLFEFHRGYLKVTANLDNSIASLSTGLTLPKLPKVRVDAPELEAKKAIENALETLAQKNRDNYSRANAVGALSGATAGGVVAGSGVAGGGAGGGKFGTGTGSDLMANWEYLYSLKNADKIGYVKELGDQLKYETLQPILNAVNGNPTAFLNALDTPLLSGKWSTFNDPLKWEENLVNYVKMLGGENLRSSMMLEASRGSLDPSQMVWSKVIGTVKSLSDAEIGALTARHPELRDLQQVRAEAREHPSPTLNALMDVVGANISIQEDGTISVSGQTVKKDKPKTGGKKGDRLDGGDIEEYISKWAKHYYGNNIEQLYDQYIMVSVAQGANAGRKFWKQYPQLAQYQAFSNKLWKRYKENKSGPPTKQQELDKIVKGVGIMMSSSKQQARGDSNQNSYSIMREIISNRKMYLPKSPIKEKSNKIDGSMFANVIAVIKASNPNLAITFAEFMQANPVRRQAMLQSNPDLARYITQFTPEQLGDIEQSYNVGLEIGGQSTSRGGGVRVYQQRSGRTGL